MYHSYVSQWRQLRRVHILFTNRRTEALPLVVVAALKWTVKLPNQNASDITHNKYPYYYSSVQGPRKHRHAHQHQRTRKQFVISWNHMLRLLVVSIVLIFGLAAATATFAACQVQPYQSGHTRKSFFLVVSIYGCRRKIRVPFVPWNIYRCSQFDLNHCRKL